jgi:hypothetical protein
MHPPPPPEQCSTRIQISTWMTKKVSQITVNYSDVIRNIVQLEQLSIGKKLEVADDEEANPNFCRATIPDCSV